MNTIFLESHNLKNKYSGFGQFNHHFIKALYNHPDDDLKITLHAKNIAQLKEEFGNYFKYKKYHSLTRYKPFRIKKKYDLWHCMNQNIKIEPFFDIPYILTVHDVHFVTEGTKENREKLISKFNEKLKRCHAIVYISEFAKHDTHNWFNVPNIPEFVIYNGNTITEITLPKEYHPKLEIKKPFLFSIGDFTERKNFISLIKMLRLLPDYNLVLAGNNQSGYARELTVLISNYRLQKRVFQIGKIDDIEKQYYLKNCEAFVFPSLREGFGIPPIEAMRFGKPIFISNNTSLPEIGGEYSFYWDHYEPDYMAEVFIKGMEHYKNKMEFYQNWYIERAKSFCWDNTAKLYLNVYKRILN